MFGVELAASLGKFYLYLGCYPGWSDAGIHEPDVDILRIWATPPGQRSF
jgi:hypothetical protein